MYHNIYTNTPSSLIKLFLYTITLYFLLNNTFYSQTNQHIANKVENLLKEMTLEEKVGQMTQLTIASFLESKVEEGQDINLSITKLRKGIVENHIGSILDNGGSAQSLKSWHNIITTIQNIATKETRLKIPIIYGIDAIHGANYIKNATIFPHAIAMAATRNIPLMKKIGEITALETRASGVPWNFNPVLGIGREPIWSRLYETFGEDVYLVTQFGKAYIQGQQGNSIGCKDKVATCMKHFIGYSVPKSGIDRTPAWIPIRMLREIFLPPFEEAIKEGSPTIMINSSHVNGIPVHSSKFLLTDLLKKELAFKGFAVSDWEDVKRLYTRDKIAKSPKEAVAIAVNAGIDMSMVPFDYSFYHYLVELVKEGTVSINRIDDAVRRILTVKFQLGLFDNPYPDPNLLKNFASRESKKVNLEAAQESITLLKNLDSVLPLKNTSKVLVTGPSSNSLSRLNGGWTITWQGNNEALFPQEELTILESIQNKIGQKNVKYVDFKNRTNLDLIIQKVKEVDAVILCLGEEPYTEGTGIIKNLYLPKSQLDFAKEISKYGKPVILVLVEGRPRIINEIVDDMSGILMAYLPGMKGGKAIADIIFGDVNPSGKLPITYPKHTHYFQNYDLHNIEVGKNNIKYDPQWKFGFGLSYTTFEYSNLTFNKNEISINDTLKIFVDIKNTGNLTGKEVAEVYLSDLYASVSRPHKQLKRFKKIELKKGESKTIQFALTSRDLAFIGRANKKIIEPGKFKISINNLEKIFILK